MSDFARSRYRESSGLAKCWLPLPRFARDSGISRERHEPSAGKRGTEIGFQDLEV